MEAVPEVQVEGDGQEFVIFKSVLDRSADALVKFVLDLSAGGVVKCVLGLCVA